MSNVQRERIKAQGYKAGDAYYEAAWGCGGKTKRKRNSPIPHQFVTDSSTNSSPIHETRRTRTKSEKFDPSHENHPRERRDHRKPKRLKLDVEETRDRVHDVEIAAADEPTDQPTYQPADQHADQHADQPAPAHHWSEEETRILKLAIEIDRLKAKAARKGTKHPINWKEVAERVSTRSVSQCRRRWPHVNPETSEKMKQQERDRRERDRRKGCQQDQEDQEEIVDKMLNLSPNIMQCLRMPDLDDTFNLDAIERDVLKSEESLTSVNGSFEDSSRKGGVNFKVVSNIHQRFHFASTNFCTPSHSLLRQPNQRISFKFPPPKPPNSSQSLDQFFGKLKTRPDPLLMKPYTDYSAQKVAQGHSLTSSVLPIAS